jgi:hypothetical protein
LPSDKKLALSAARDAENAMSFDKNITSETGKASKKFPNLSLDAESKISKLCLP